MNRAKQKHSNFLAVCGNRNISREKKFLNIKHILCEFQIKFYVYVVILFI